MIDAGQLKAIFGAHLRIDFRRSRAGGGALRQRELSTWARMLLSSLFYLVMGGAVAGTAFAAEDRATYAVILLAYVLVMLGMMILMEFGVMAMQTEDQVVLGSRPVDSATYTAARAANLAVFVGFYGIAVSVLPLGAAALAPVGGPRFALSLLAAMFLGVLAVAGYLLMAYGLILRRLKAETARDLLSWLTIGFTIAVPVAYMLLRMGMERNGLRIRLPIGEHPWLEWLPPVWLAALAEGRRDPRALAFLGASIPAWVWVLRFGAFRLGDGRSEAPARSEASVRSPGLTWLRPLFATPAEWGIFRLLLTYIRRDRGSKAKLYPQFGMPIAILAVALYQGMRDPWTGEKAGFWPYLAAMHPALTLAWIPLLLRFSDQWEAAWIFAVAPGATLSDMARGLHRATLILLMVPAFAATWIVFAIAWGSPGHALLHVLPPFLGTVALMDVSLVWRKPVALSCRYIKGEGGTRMALTFTLMALFTGLGVVQALCAGSLALTGLLIAVLLTLVFALDWMLTAVLSGRAIAVKDL